MRVGIDRGESEGPVRYDADKWRVPNMFRERWVLGLVKHDQVPLRLHLEYGTLSMACMAPFESRRSVRNV